MKHKRIFIASLLIMVMFVLSACSFGQKQKINFYVDGQIYATQTLEKGKAISMPIEPTLEGYEFDGWYWDYDEWQVPFTGNEMIEGTIDGDAEVFAKWVEATTPPETPSDPETPSEPEDPETPSEPEEPETPEEPSEPEVEKYTITLNLNNGTSNSPLTEEVEAGKAYKLPVPERESYAFMGWKVQTSNVIITDKEGNSLSNYDYDKDITAIAMWQRFYLTVTNSSASKGTATTYNNEAIVPGTEITLEATPNERYVFAGWYSDTELVSAEASYTITMPYEDVNLKAKWDIRKVKLTTFINEGPHKEFCKFAKTFDNTEVEYGDEIRLRTSSDYNYTFLGWYKNGELYLTGETIYITPYEDTVLEARWAAIYLRAKVSSYNAGEIEINAGNGIETIKSSYEKLTKPNTATELKATTLPNYTWVGWYKNGEFLTKDYEISYDTTYEDCEFLAKYIYCPIKISVNDENAGTVSRAETSTIGEYMTIKATGNVGYVFKGWYKDDELVTNELEYEVCVGEEKQYFVAKWEACTNHEYVNCYCACGADCHNPEVYCMHGDKVYFGSYPQTEVKDEALIAALNEIAKNPTENSQKWKQYKYVSGEFWKLSTMQFVKMYYYDIEHEGEKYRGVYISQYRPINVMDSMSESNSRQDDYGYKLSTAYWFKYEPVRWTVVGKDSKTYALVADIILDGQQYENYYEQNSSGYYVDANGSNIAKWKNSSLREWLNHVPINDIFSQEQQAMLAYNCSSWYGDASFMNMKDGLHYCEAHPEGIKPTYSTKCDEGSFDQIYLSNINTIKDSDTIIKAKVATDYAKIQGANNNYFLRDCRSDSELSSTDGKRAYFMLEDGTLTGTVYNYSAQYYGTIQGVVPAVNIIIN